MKEQQKQCLQLNVETSGMLKYQVFKVYKSLYIKFSSELLQIVQVLNWIHTAK